MSAVRERVSTPPKRRVPTQQRSRRRVEELLDAAARLVVERGVEALSTRDIALAAGAPVASLYQYFADKESVLLALAERDASEMDKQVLEDLAQVEVLSMASMVRTTMSAFVEIYLRGRTNRAVNQFGREHNIRVAESLRGFAVDAGLARPELSLTIALLAVEVGDRIFQLAFERDPRGEPELIEEGITMVSSYLERYATPVGLAGIRR